MSSAVNVFHGRFARIALCRLERGIIAHAHREGHFLFHVDGSTGHMNVHGAQYPISGRVALMIDPWQAHAYVPDSAVGQYLLVMCIRPTWFHNFQDETRSWSVNGATSFLVTPKLARTIAQAVALSSEGGREGMLDCVVHCLVADSCRLTREADEGPQMSRWLTQSADFRIRKSIRLMGDRFDANFDVARLATDSGLSRPHFFKLFRKQIGVTPKMFWNALRLERAFQDLVETGKPLADISFELGFSSQSSFSRFFAMNTGLAPSDYRRAGHIVSGGAQDRARGRGVTAAS